MIECYFIAMFRLVHLNHVFHYFTYLYTCETVNTASKKCCITGLVLIQLTSKHIDVLPVLSTTIEIKIS